MSCPETQSNSLFFHLLKAGCFGIFMITNDDAEKQEICVLNTYISGDKQHKILDYLDENPPPDGVEIGLSEVSPRDAKWDEHRSNTQSVQDIFNENLEFENWASRMNDCSGYLQFVKDDNTGIKLTKAFFCHVRHCPVCIWRKSLYYKAMMYQALDIFRAKYPTHRFVFLTLTVRNCEIKDLRSELKLMNIAWKRLIERKFFESNVVGWIRATEVTRDSKRKNTHAHPHFHAILAVRPSYFSSNRVVHNTWVETWAECLRVDYRPSVRISAIRPKKGAKGDYETQLRNAVAETLKYSVKAKDMIGDGSLESKNWLYEYAKQVHKLRFIASGGEFKNFTKIKISDDEMVHLSNENQEVSVDTMQKKFYFSYKPTKRKYVYVH